MTKPNLSRVIEDHPFQIGATVVSTIVLITTSIGFYSEYRLLDSFGINIATFSELDDFLIAGLKKPIIAILIPFSIIASFIFYWRAKSSESSILSIIIVLLLIIYILYLLVIHIPGNYIKKDIESIRNIENPMILYLKTKDVLGTKKEPLSFITSTERIIFFYHRTTNSTLIVPVLSVDRIELISKKSTQ